MFGVDDLLVAFASAAGQAAGKEIAKQLIQAICSDLATKEDIARAVAEIEQYVHQELRSIEDSSIIVDVDTAVKALSQYKLSNNRIDLSEENTQQLLNRCSSEIQRAIHDDGNYPWREFVAISRFVAVYSTFWAIKVFELKEENEVANFIDVLLEGGGLLQSVIQRIHAMEDEFISEFNVQYMVKKENLGEPGGHQVFGFSNYSRASYELHRGRYEGGVLCADTGWMLGHSLKPNDAVKRLRPGYDADVARIEAEKNFRQKKIYDPLSESVMALQALVTKMGGTQKDILDRFA